jgi:hypothetical protein
MPSASSVSAVCFMVGQSDWLPMMIATGFPAIDPSKRPKKKRAIIGTVLGVARRRHNHALALSLSETLSTGQQTPFIPAKAGIQGP